MKLSYTYIGQGHTVVKLNEKDYAGVKVRTGQTVQSDRDPRYFLTSGFISADIKSTADIDLIANKLKLNKSVAELEKKASKTVLKEIGIQELSVEEIKAKLTELGVAFRGNTGRAKLEKMLRTALETSEETSEEVSKEEVDQPEENI